MKLSSISLITAALAAIAGSVFAAPCPLYARALENVNSLSERDDVYSRGSGLALPEREVDDEFNDDLFIRTKSEAAEAHDSAAEAGSAAKRLTTRLEATKAREKAEQTCKEAATAARKAAANARKTEEKAREAARKAHVIADATARVTGDKADRREAYRHQGEANNYHNEANDHDNRATGHDREQKSHKAMKDNHKDPKTPIQPGNSRKQAEKSTTKALQSISTSKEESKRYQDAFDRKEATVAEYNGHPAVAEYNTARNEAATILLLHHNGGHSK